MNYNFSGFIWSPANKYIDEILELINTNHTVLHYYNYEFENKEDFSNSVLNIYTTDDVNPEKVKNVKIKNMINHSFSYIYFKFYISEPNFRKKTTSSNISKDVEVLKKNIRDKYKTKINNYVHDIIIHISDNYEQTTAIEQIMKKYEKNRINEFINLKYFLKCNFKNNVFNRADMLVRKYSIEQYLKDKIYDFGFYKKMQQKRTGKNSSEYVIKFKELIDSIQKNGINNNYPIKYSFNYLLRDGSHRLSYALLLNKTFIAVKPMKWDNHNDYSIEWFKKNKFNETELDIINIELEKLFL
tara:strand:+ start:1616 stop:2512 length:897 start_codon:yes stop_codon:yes gene_type:complete